MWACPCNKILVLGQQLVFLGKRFVDNGKHQVNLNVNDFLDAPVRLKYSYLTVLPQGLQDNGGGYLDGNLISVGGFCGGNDAFGYPYCCGKRGFLDNAWYLPLKEDSKNSANKCWKDLPQFPGKARQGLNCVSNGGKKELYCWAGISYTPLKAKEKNIGKLHSKKADPYGYIDGFKLSSPPKVNLSGANYPTYLVASLRFNQLIMCDDDDSSLYLFGGADYDSNQFHTSKDRNGANKGLGSYLWKFSISKAKGMTETSKQCLDQTSQFARDPKIYYSPHAPQGTCMLSAGPLRALVMEMTIPLNPYWIIGNFL